MPDGAPDRLDDVHLGATGVDERHTVEGGNVDAFGEAAGVGEQSALSVVESAQLLEPNVALASGHLTRGIARPQRTLRALPGRHPCDDFGHLGGELAGTRDAGVERDGAV